MTRKITNHKNSAIKIERNDFQPCLIAMITAGPIITNTYIRIIVMTMIIAKTGSGLKERSRLDSVKNLSKYVSPTTPITESKLTDALVRFNILIELGGF